MAEAQLSFMNAEKKNEGRNKNPILREMLGKPVKDRPQEIQKQPQQQPKQKNSSKNFSEFQMFWNDLQNELDEKNFESSNSPPQLFPSLDFQDLEDESVLFQKYLTPTVTEATPTLKRGNSVPNGAPKKDAYPAFSPISPGPKSTAAAFTDSSAMETATCIKSPTQGSQGAFSGVEDSILTELRRRHKLKRKMTQRSSHPTYPLQEELRTLRSLKDAMNANVQQMEILINFLEDYFRRRRVQFVSM
ncbi:uncharacterized protein LOC134265973 [Saccostrea cucullata]|uniref:uncharacterized protein LOC134265973 n=1 Tax=Saccostrea cuccullata TaxID=36930 RepID=UPI002ED35D91